MAAEPKSQARRSSRPVSTGAIEREHASFNLAKTALAEAPMQDLAREVVQAVRDQLGADFAYVMKHDPGRGDLVLKASVGFEPGSEGDALDGAFSVPARSAARHGYVSQASFTFQSSCDPVVVEDFEAHPLLEPCELLRRHEARCGVTVCVAPDRDTPYGIVGAHWRGLREVPPEHAHWLEDVAGVLADADARRKARERSAPPNDNLRDALRLLVSAGNASKALEAAAATLVARGADWSFVDLVEDDEQPGYTAGDTIRRVVVTRAKAPDADTDGEAELRELAQELAANYPLDPDSPLGTPRVLNERRSHFCAEVTAGLARRSANDAGHRRLIDRVCPTQYAAAPIWSRGRVVGALIAASTHGRRLTETFLPSVEEIAELASLVLQESLAGLTPARERRELAGLARAATDVGAVESPEVPGARSERLPGALAETPPGEPAPQEPPVSPAPRIITFAQRDVLELCAGHFSQQQIADELGITVQGVKTRLKDAATRLGVKGGWRAVYARAVSLGEILPPGGAKPHDDAPSPQLTLTNAQKKVLLLSRQHLSRPEIARKLGVSVGTVKTHIYNAGVKLGTNGGARAAIREAERRGEIAPR